MSSGGCGKPGHVTAGSDEGTQWCATCVSEGEALAPWRVGHKVPINVYRGDRAVCQCHNELDARALVDGMNTNAKLRKALRRLVEAVERDDNPSTEGHSSYSDEMNEARDALKAQKAPH